MSASILVPTMYSGPPQATNGPLAGGGTGADAVAPAVPTLSLEQAAAPGAPRAAPQGPVPDPAAGLSPGTGAPTGGGPAGGAAGLHVAAGGGTGGVGADLYAGDRTGGSEGGDAAHLPGAHRGTASRLGVPVAYAGAHDERPPQGLHLRTSDIVAVHMAVDIGADTCEAARRWTSRVPRWRPILAYLAARAAEAGLTTADCWPCGDRARMHELSGSSAPPPRRRANGPGFVTLLVGLLDRPSRSLACERCMRLCQNPSHYMDPVYGAFNPFEEGVDALASVAHLLTVPLLCRNDGAGGLGGGPAAGYASSGASSGGAPDTVNVAAWDELVPRWRAVLSDMIAVLDSGTGPTDCWKIPDFKNMRFEMTYKPAIRIRCTSAGFITRLMGFGDNCVRSLKCQYGTGRCANVSHYTPDHLLSLGLPSGCTGRQQYVASSARGPYDQDPDDADVTAVANFLPTTGLSVVADQSNCEPANYIQRPVADGEAAGGQPPAPLPNGQIPMSLPKLPSLFGSPLSPALHKPRDDSDTRSAVPVVPLAMPAVRDHGVLCLPDGALPGSVPPLLLAPQDYWGGGPYALMPLSAVMPMYQSLASLSAIVMDPGDGGGAGGTRPHRPKASTTPRRPRKRPAEAMQPGEEQEEMFGEV